MSKNVFCTHAYLERCLYQIYQGDRTWNDHEKSSFFRKYSLVFVLQIELL